MHRKSLFSACINVQYADEKINKPRDIPHFLSVKTMTQPVAIFPLDSFLSFISLSLFLPVPIFVLFTFFLKPKIGDIKISTLLVPTLFSASHIIDYLISKNVLEYAAIISFCISHHLRMKKGYKIKL
jgi:hypothetical protein